MAEMQNVASPLDSDWLDVRSRLPPDLDLNQLARDTLAIQRSRGISDAEIQLSPEHERELNALVRAHSTPQKLAERARIILLAASGLGA